jgi:hypothetical protein
MVAGLGAVALLFCASSLASADLERDEVDTSGQDEATASLLADEQWVLEHLGFQPLPYESHWSVITTRVGELVPEDYAGALIANDVYYVGFKNDVPVAVAEILAEFPAEYIALTNLGFSQVDIQLVSAAVVEVIQQVAPGTVFMISPTAVSAQVIVSIDPASIPDVALSDGTPIPFSLDSSLYLSDTQLQSLQALASHLGTISAGGVQLEIVTETVEQVVPWVAVAGGKALGNGRTSYPDKYVR